MLEGSFPMSRGTILSDRVLRPVAHNRPVDSLLEDAFGNAFAGKYESIFLVNQERRNSVQAFRDWSDGCCEHHERDALAYRSSEALISRMSRCLTRAAGLGSTGSTISSGSCGCGYLVNTLYGKEDILRRVCSGLVAGLGTRAVNRVETIILELSLLTPTP